MLDNGGRQKLIFCLFAFTPSVGIQTTDYGEAVLVSPPAGTSGTPFKSNIPLMTPVSQQSAVAIHHSSMSEDNEGRQLRAKLSRASGQQSKSGMAAAREDPDLWRSHAAKNIDPGSFSDGANHEAETVGHQPVSPDEKQGKVCPSTGM